jgi:hypothetical protein
MSIVGSAAELDNFAANVFSSARATATLRDGQTIRSGSNLEKVRYRQRNVRWRIS